MLARYSRPDMERVWSEEHKFALWLKVEVAVCEARAVAGEIPPDAMPDIRRATFDVIARRVSPFLVRSPRCARRVCPAGTALSAVALRVLPKHGPSSSCAR